MSPQTGVIDVAAPNEAVAYPERRPSPHPDRRWSRASWKPPALGLALTLLQTALVLATTGACSLREGYPRLCAWDSGWYACIIEQGYQSDIPPRRQTVTSNVAFFPGYPLLARGVRDLTGLQTSLAEALTAQLACWGFWTYLHLTWRRWRVPGPLAFAGTLAVLAHPGAFFLVCGYSESLFLLGAVGFLYWAHSSRRVAMPLAALHGGSMTATRLVGIPLALLPPFEALLPGRPPGNRLRRLLAPALLAVLASLGAGTFFAWCHFRFGHWNLYQQTQAIGWGIRPNYWSAFDWHTYTPVIRLSLRRSSWTSAYFWSRLTLPLTLLSFAALLWRELLSAGQALPCRRMRAGLYLGAGLVFYISLSAMANGGFDCMVRHQLSTHVLLVMAAVHLFTVAPERAFAGGWWWLLPAGASLAAHCYFAYRFTHGHWVA
jgi:hypothetical protein